MSLILSNPCRLVVTDSSTQHASRSPRQQSFNQCKRIPKVMAVDVRPAQEAYLLCHWSLQKHMSVRGFQLLSWLAGASNDTDMVSILSGRTDWSGSTLVSRTPSTRVPNPDHREGSRQRNPLASSTPSTPHVNRSREESTRQTSVTSRTASTRPASRSHEAGSSRQIVIAPRTPSTRRANPSHGEGSSRRLALSSRTPSTLPTNRSHGEGPSRQIPFSSRTPTTRLADRSSGEGSSLQIFLSRVAKNNSTDRMAGTVIIVPVLVPVVIVNLRVTAASEPKCVKNPSVSSKGKAKDVTPHR